MSLSKETLYNHKKEILTAAAALALAAAARRSMKTEGDHITFDVSIWSDRIDEAGRRIAMVLADALDDTKKVAGRLAGTAILGPNNEVIDVEPADELPVTESSLMALASAVSNKMGWSGQPAETIDS